jgi:hypothetical protein
VYEDVLSKAWNMGLVAFPQKMRQMEIVPYGRTPSCWPCREPSHRLRE